MKILIAGATGMLGRAAVAAWASEFEVYATAARPAPDFPGAVPFQPFSFKSENYQDLAGFCSPDVVLNCAALTDHRYCDENPQTARLINAEAPAKLAAVFPKAYFIHISTDAVFGNDAVFPDETVRPAPVSEYGKSKYAGEKLLLSANPRALALRTTIVGLGGRRASPSLAEWLLGRLAAGNEVDLFTDALFTPINIWDFIRILGLCLRDRPGGVLHAAGGERVSKHDFGVMLARRLGFAPGLIRPALLADSAARAGRRLDQSICSGQLERLFNIALPTAEECAAGLAGRF